MTPNQREELIDAYAWYVVDSMDLKTICQWCAESIAHDLENKSDEYVIEVIKDDYPELLETE